MKASEKEMWKHYTNTSCPVKLCMFILWIFNFPVTLLTAEYIKVPLPICSVYWKMLVWCVRIVSGTLIGADHGSRNWDCTRYTSTTLRHADPCIRELQQIHLSYRHHKKGICIHLDSFVISFFQFGLFHLLIAMSLCWGNGENSHGWGGKQLSVSAQINARSIVHPWSFCGLSEIPDCNPRAEIRGFLTQGCDLNLRDKTLQLGHELQK
jgi:hypothetical protein